MQKADKIRLGCYILAVAAARLSIAKSFHLNIPLSPNISYSKRNPTIPFAGHCVSFNQNQVHAGRETKQLDRAPLLCSAGKNPDGTAGSLTQWPISSSFRRERLPKVKYSYYSWLQQKTRSLKTGFHVINCRSPLLRMSVSRLKRKQKSERVPVPGKHLSG